MAYGAMHGGGVSLYDLMALAEDIESGIIGTPLAASSGLCLATRNGEALLACSSLCGEGSAFANELYSFQAERIRGQAAAPLLTAKGEEITDHNGTVIFAQSIHSEREHENDHAVTEAVAAVMRIMDANRRECLEELYGLAANLIRGIAAAPLLTANGEQICDRNCIALAAVKNL